MSILDLCLSLNAFGLCNAPAMFQHCMLSLFSDIVKYFLVIFMDDFFIYGDSFNQCLHYLEFVLQCCAKKNLTLNEEKCHFIVRYDIVLDYEISRKGIEMDKPKINVIAKLPMPKCMKDIRFFLRTCQFLPKIY